MVESDDEAFEYVRNCESGSESGRSVQSLIKLDRSLLIDLSLLRIGSMISSGTLSVVHEGLWVTFFFLYACFPGSLIHLSALFDDNVLLFLSFRCFRFVFLCCLNRK